MFNIDKGHCVTIEQKLLWNIQELLTAQSQPKFATEVFSTSNNFEVLKADEVTKIKCKKCNAEFENTGFLLAHMKKEHKGGK